MAKQGYVGFGYERQSWRNSHRKYSKLSKYRIERILDCFIRDLTVLEAWEKLSFRCKKSPISKKTM